MEQLVTLGDGPLLQFEGPDLLREGPCPVEQRWRLWWRSHACSWKARRCWGVAMLRGSAEEAGQGAPWDVRPIIKQTMRRG